MSADQGVYMKIRIHYRDQHSGPWSSAIAEADQIPRIGDFVAPAARRVFRVVLTLHVLFDADYDAEVFAELADFEEVQSETLGEVVWRE
jgi:hypothetical protein